MTLSDTQLKAVEEATRILASAGLSLSDLANPQSPHPGLDAPRGSVLDDSQINHPSSSVCSSLYEPPRAKMFTPDEQYRRVAGSRLNRQAFVDGIVDHPMGVIVEYPETGAQPGQSITHRFVIDPVNFLNPKADFQYSLGDGHGGRKDAQCLLLQSHNGGESVLCSHLRTSCEYLQSRYITTHLTIL